MRRPAKTYLLLILLCIYGQEVAAQLKSWPKVSESSTWFPVESFRTTNFAGMNVIDSLYLGILSAQLDYFKEPKLFQGHKGPLYRFMWTRSFDPPMVMTLTKSDTGALLTYKTGNRHLMESSYWDLTKLSKPEKAKLNKYFDHEIDSLAIADIMVKAYVRDTVKFRFNTVKRVIQPDEYDQFVQLYNKSDFSEIPTLKDRSGCDGAGWLLEALDENGQYHVVYRWSPGTDSDPVFRELGLSIIRLVPSLKKDRRYKDY
jgi:hypothetical protein